MESFNSRHPEKLIYSVSELNRETKNLLSTHFSSIQVEGEISNLSAPSSGHIYFSLKDQKAQIRCAMFKSQQRRLGFKPKNGKQVIVSAQVSLYEARGDYQLIVDKMQEAGLGDLQRLFDQLKTRLLNEGLFEQDLKQALPEIPKQIGVITSPTGAAIHDILTVLKRRFPAIPVIIYPTSVQGEIAKPEICEAISEANKLKQVDILTVLKRRFPAIPVIVYPTSVQGESAKSEICDAISTANKLKQVNIILLARGGGSLEDLWAFNEESVARAIVKSKIPIISAIGHEVDFTIADFVADLRAPTPSAAAETVVPDQQIWYSRFQTLEQQLQQQILRKISQDKQSIDWLHKRLQQQHPGQQIQRYSQTLDNLELGLLRAIRAIIKHNKNLVESQNNGLQQYNPVNKIIRYKEQQQYLKNRLNSAMHHKLETLGRNFHALVQTLNAVSPLATLERGYAIVSNPDTSAVIRSSRELSIKDSIKTRLAHGQIISQIKEINHD